MVIFKHRFRKVQPTTPSEEEYIDLTELVFEGEVAPEVKSQVKLAEISRFEDISTLTNQIYQGNILIIDYTSLASDQLTLKRVTAELKNVLKDTHGDMAGIGKNMLVVTPSGIRIDRQKLKFS